LKEAGECKDAPVYQGVSYCDALRRAGEGERLRVLPGSIQVCGWAPVTLGLKVPQGRFEEALAPRLAFPVTGLLLTPLVRFSGQPEPELVVVRARPEVLREMIQVAGVVEGDGLSSLLWEDHAGRLDRSALPLLTSGRATPRLGLIGAVNRVLAPLARFGPWQALTRRLFRSGLVTAGFDALISRTLADMSVCRNSTVVPLLAGRVNVSFFCTGGITWGRNPPHHLTSGWPWPLFQRLYLPHSAMLRGQQSPIPGETHD
jgi:hypothetical protein